MVCLLGCWDDAPALGIEDGVCRKAAKKVERKKGRWEDMLMRGAVLRRRTLRSMQAVVAPPVRRTDGQGASSGV